MLRRIEELKSTCDIYVDDILTLKKLLRERENYVRDTIEKIRDFQAQKETEVVQLNVTLTHYQTCIDAIVDADPYNSNLQEIIDTHLGKIEEDDPKYNN